LSIFIFNFLSNRALSVYPPYHSLCHSSNALYFGLQVEKNKQHNLCSNKHRAQRTSHMFTGKPLSGYILFALMCFYSFIARKFMSKKWRILRNVTIVDSFAALICDAGFEPDTTVTTYTADGTINLIF